MKINATKLKFAMARKCMSSRDLAKSANVSYDSVVSFLSRRRDTTTKTLGKIAKALDVDPETLIDQKLGGDVEREVAYENCNSSERFEI